MNHVLRDRFWCGGREGALVFFFGLGRHRVTLEGHEEDIVKMVLRKVGEEQMEACRLWQRML